MMRPLAMSLGDPAGIGPELLLRAWMARVEQGLPSFAAIGGAELLAQTADHCGLDVPIRRIASLDEASTAFQAALPVLGEADCTFRPGLPDEDSAHFALNSLREATRLAVAGEAAGLVTGPVAKSRLAAIGFAHPGQTEFVADACGVAAENAVMMLAGPDLRVVPVTVHCALADVAGLLSEALILAKARTTLAALRDDFSIAPAPVLAIAALNPHAGEDGRMGDEEMRVIAPAIAQLREEGHAITGPHPADSLFAPRARSSYDAALCMYHDQALVPLKALHFDEGVNVTLGLPVVRTSPDHGTAFDIAGSGQADPGATIAAIRIAGTMAMRRATA